MSKTREIATRLLYLYQRFFWYVSIAKGEALKPFGFWNEALLILTFLAVKDVEFGLGDTAAAYLLVLLVAGVAGKVIVAAGVVKYNARIANRQNPELMEVHEIRREIGEMRQEMKGLLDRKEIGVAPSILLYDHPPCCGSKYHHELRLSCPEGHGLYEYQQLETPWHDMSDEEKIKMLESMGSCKECGTKKRPIFVDKPTRGVDYEIPVAPHEHKKEQ